MKKNRHVCSDTARQPPAVFIQGLRDRDTFFPSLSGFVSLFHFGSVALNRFTIRRLALSSRGLQTEGVREQRVFPR